MSWELGFLFGVLYVTAQPFISMFVRQTSSKLFIFCVGKVIVDDLSGAC